MVSEITINQEEVKNHIKEKGYVSVSDPCCGSGRMLFSNLQAIRDAGIDLDNIYFEASDISKFCCAMTYVNLSLSGVSAIVFNKNTLTNKVYDTYFTPALINNKKLLNNLIRDGIIKKKEEDNIEYD